MRAPLRFALLAAAILAAAGAPASAQSVSISVQAQPSQGEWTGDLPRHFEGIALTAAQKSKIAELQKKYHALMDALRDSTDAVGGATTDNPALQKRLGEVMAEEHAAFKALLDEEGRRRFDANMAKMHGAGHGAGHEAAKEGSHGAGHGAGHGSGRPPAR